MPRVTEIKPPVSAGEIVGGKYRIGAVLGAGGMGVVVAAEHVSFSQRVAVKFMRPDARPEDLARFHREANVVVQLRSEHVCRVIDHGTIASGDMYIVMELLEGRDLDRLVRESGPLSPADAVEYVLQASEALAEAHLAGVVHRDIKPSNLFLTTRPDGSPCVKLLDFGISKDQTSLAALTATGMLLGSVHFMSPEQLGDAKTVDLRSDIWSLGATLYEILAAAVPFEAESLSEMALKIMYDPPRDLDAVRPELAGIAPVVKRCLAKDPAHRYENLAALALALAPFAPERAHTYVDRVTGMYERIGWRPAERVTLRHSDGANVFAATVDRVDVVSPGQTVTTANVLQPQPGLPAFMARDTVPRADAAPAGRRGLLLGLVSLVAVTSTGLWLYERARADETDDGDDAETDDDDDDDDDKKKQKKSKAKQPPPQELPRPDPNDDEPSWVQAPAMFTELRRTHSGARRVLLLRFYQDYAEMALDTRADALAFERFVWRGRRLTRTGPHDHGLRSPRDAHQRTAKLSDLIPSVPPRLPTDVVAHVKVAISVVSSIELRAQDGKAFWVVSMSSGEFHHYDMQGSYITAW